MIQGLLLPAQYFSLLFDVGHQHLLLLLQLFGEDLLSGDQVSQDPVCCFFCPVISVHCTSSSTSADLAAVDLLRVGYSSIYRCTSSRTSWKVAAGWSLAQRFMSRRGVRSLRFSTNCSLSSRSLLASGAQPNLSTLERACACVRACAKSCADSRSPYRLPKNFLLA